MKTKKPVIGIIGAGQNASEEMLANAYNLGKLIAKNNWFLLNGGRNVGVMEMSSKGAFDHDGFVIGVLPGDSEVSEYISVCIDTGMGNARNNVIVRSADILISLGGGAGTLSEMSLALKAQKRLIVLNPNEDIKRVLISLDSPGKVEYVSTPEDAIQVIQSILH